VGRGLPNGNVRKHVIGDYCVQECKDRKGPKTPEFHRHDSHNKKRTVGKKHTDALSQFKK
jgi:hypothetical protein